MVPERQLGDERDDPPAIGVMFAVGRWIHPRVKPPLRETVEIERGYSIAPTYKNQDPIDAEAETTFIKDKFKGVSIKPVSFTNLNHELGRGPVSLLHFIAHGQADADEDRILLDRDHPLTSQRLLGMTGVRTGCRSGRPLVFLNACEVGRPIGGLTGAGGFARAFATLGMTAMIAPLWSVDTEIASQVAIEIYEEALKAPRRSLAEIVREIRSRALEPGVDGWQDSRAAYCLYGHPSARLA